jgi:hypothetical protein
MENIEVSNNSHQIQKNEFIVKLKHLVYIKINGMKKSIDEVNLPYENTKWGKFYSIYKEQGQLQLQKFLEATNNELENNKLTRLYEKLKWLQHIFYNTEYDNVTNSFRTPNILLKQNIRYYNKKGYLTDASIEDADRIKTVVDAVYSAYRARCLDEYNEVKAFYETKKNEIKLKQLIVRKQNAKQLICCEFCQCQIARNHLARHHKSIKCLEHQLKD